jgi:hypothetical protein
MPRTCTHKIRVVVTAAITRSRSLRIGQAPMDALTIFGLVAVTAMLMFYALEDHSPWFILAFAGACVLASVYGFLQGAWPFGIIEAIWAGVAVHRWRIRTRVYEYTP